MLNAFRHHGERDLNDTQARSYSLIYVLNAFRHHGERDLNTLVPFPNGTKDLCSTPSGITASGTPRRRRTVQGRAGASAQRLPASRRAGLDREMAGV